MAGFQQSINQLLTTAGIGVGLYNQLPGPQIEKFDTTKTEPAKENVVKALKLQPDEDLGEALNYYGTKTRFTKEDKDIITNTYRELGVVADIYRQRGQQFPTVGFESREQLEVYKEFQSRLKDAYQDIAGKQKRSGTRLQQTRNKKKNSGGNP